MEKDKFYENKPENGRIYDWNLVRREYDRLGCPDGVYYPAINKVIEGCSHIISLSIRSTGKTTNWLLFGLCARKLYNHFQVVYVRTSEDDLTPMWSKKLVEVIRLYDEGAYIRKLTEGKYNDIIYNGKAFYYAFRDSDTGKIVEKEEEACIVCLSVDNEEHYKSSFNAPFGDMIIIDEFITKHYIPNTFFHTNNLIKTVFRDRLGGFVVWSANTTDLFSIWFQEMNIGKEVRTMKQGDTKIITSSRGMKFYIEYIAIIHEARKKNRERSNRRFFGWDTDKLNSITGIESWNFDQYPHIPVVVNEDELKTLKSNIYIDFNTDLYRVNICEDNTRGLHLRIHEATRTYEDSIILTLSEEKIKYDSRYKFGFSTGRLNKIIDKCLKQRKVYFSTNECGTGFYEYLFQYKKQK